MGRHNFLSIKDFSPEEIRYLLDLAREIKTHPAAHHGALRGKTLAMIFEPACPSTLAFSSLGASLSIFPTPKSI